MLYDISQPVFECAVFPGDNPPQRKIVSDMRDGALYNLTEFSMCAHNGTHVDAPYHFYKDGKPVDRVPLEKFAGRCFVADFDGDVTAADAKALLEKADAAGAGRKLLLKGRTTVTLPAAEVFAEAGLDLIGNESQTVGPEDAPMAVHLVLLKKETVLLEGIRLGDVPEGVYFLNCAPLNLSGADGAPCRAILCDLEGMAR